MAETRDSRFARDLLQRFTLGGGGIYFPAKPKEEAPENRRPENVELSLGLSLNGRFGVEPHLVANDNNNNHKLCRASSVTDFVNFPVDVELSLYSPLTRTCSLPPETEVEWRKRKELQSLRRSEAKRKRVEKLKNVRVVKGKTGEDWEANGRNLVNGVELWGVGLKKLPPSPPPPSPPPPVQFSSQGSIGSQGSGGSSGVSDLESQPFPGTNKNIEVKGATHDRSVRNQNGSWKVDAPMEPSSRNSSERSNQLANANFPDETSKTMQTAMPCVSTKRDGPNGRKIEGFLYRYGKGEEVRIVCVCHGNFLTPAEFVKHAGGGDVKHPLRHIIVNSSSFS